MPRLTSVSAILVFEDFSGSIALIRRLSDLLAASFAEVEIIVVANGHADATLMTKRIVAELPDVTCVMPYEPLDIDAARLVAIESAVSDHVLLVSPDGNVIEVVPDFLRELSGGHDVVIGAPPSDKRERIGLLVWMAYAGLSWLSGTRLSPEPIALAMVGRDAALYLLSRPNAELMLKSGSLGRGFAVKRAVLPNLTPRSTAMPWRYRAAKAVRLMISVGSTPVRRVGALALIASASSVAYAAYVVGIYLTKRDVEAGWTTLSLQLSGMMLLFSFMLWLVSEYVVQMYGVLAMRRRRLVARELRSPRSRAEGGLNVIDETGAYRLGAGATPDGAPLMRIEAVARVPSS